MHIDFDTFHKDIATDEIVYPVLDDEMDDAATCPRGYSYFYYPSAQEIRCDSRSCNCSPLDGVPVVRAQDSADYEADFESQCFGE